MSIVKGLFLILLFCVLIFKYCRLKNEYINQKKYFVETLSHDLRVSSLAQIRGLELLKKSSAANNLELIEEIDSSCKYSLDMISMLLNSYRFENGEQVLDYEKINITQLIKDTCSNYLKIIEDKNLRFYFDTDVSNNFINADKLKIQKAFSILISTIVAYSKNNCTAIISIKEDKNNIKIALLYQGKSLTEEECRRMFCNNSHFSTVGHGIKMNLCKKIIDFHYGKIRVENINAMLNSFTITLPKDKKCISAKGQLISSFQC